MEPDFGKRLTQARLARGVTVDEASHATRMRPGLIRALEDGNLSQFPNAAYAKSFLLMYAKFLRLDITDIAESIDTGTQMRVEDFQYLTSRASEERRLQRDATDTRYDFVVAKTGGGSWLPLIIIAIVGALGVGGFMVWNTLHRIDSTSSSTASAKPPKPSTPTPAPTHVESTPPDPEKSTDPDPAIGHPVANADPNPEHPVAPVVTPHPAANPGLIGVNPPAPSGSVPPSVPAPDLSAPPADEETTAVPLEPGTVVLEPSKKTWVTIRTGPGGQPLFEDYLYPSAKAMHLPAGRYFIELRDASAVEITKDGKIIAYTSPGVLVD